MNVNQIIHGTPITPKRLLEQLKGENFCVSYAYPEQLHDVGPMTTETGILLLDNGAFTTWKQGRDFDEQGFWDWANAAQDLYPQAVAVIPDKITGNEEDNWMMAARAIRGGLAKYPERTMFIWHTNDSIAQLKKACLLFNFIGIGSCEGTDIILEWAAFEKRIQEANMTIEAVDIICGRRPWVHIMRGLGKYHKFRRFDSADSSNIARNHCRTKGNPNHVRVMADRIRRKVKEAA